MTSQQRAEFRDTYNQLRLALIYPGESLAGVTKPYAPVDKWSLTYDELLALPDTPDIAARRNVRLSSLWATIGMRRAVA